MPCSEVAPLLPSRPITVLQATFRKESLMRALALVAIGVLTYVPIAHAQLNTYYEGVVRVDGKDQPLTTRYSIEKGRVAAVMSGARSSRMIFTEKDGTLRVIDDSSKSYFDLDRKSLESVTGGAMAEAQKQMANMPPEQRAMEEKLIRSNMRS